MGGSPAILQDHPVSDYHPGISQSPTQDKEETPSLKGILHVFGSYFLSLTILHSLLTMDELAVLRVTRDEFGGGHILCYTPRQKETNPGP